MIFCNLLLGKTLSKFALHNQKKLLEYKLGICTNNNWKNNNLKEQIFLGQSDILLIFPNLCWNLSDTILEALTVWLYTKISSLFYFIYRWLPQSGTYSVCRWNVSRILLKTTCIVCGLFPSMMLVLNIWQCQKNQNNFVNQLLVTLSQEWTSPKKTRYYLKNIADQVAWYVLLVMVGSKQAISFQFCFHSEHPIQRFYF